MDSTPRSRNRPEVSRAEKPPPMKSTSTLSTIGSRGVTSGAYGSFSYRESSPCSSVMYWLVPSGRYCRRRSRSSANFALMAS